MMLPAGVFTLVLTLAAAHGPRAGGKKKRTPPPATTVERRVVPPARADAKRAEPAPNTTTADHGNDAAEPARSASPEGQSGTVTTKTAKTKVYTFGAMDVEGKLKTPQLLYFLNRIKLELEMSAPDHRSFMKELERTADDPSL